MGYHGRSKKIPILQAEQGYIPDINLVEKGLKEYQNVKNVKAFIWKSYRLFHTDLEHHNMKDQKYATYYPQN